MSTLLDVAAAVQDVCVTRDWPFCFIGGIAVQRWGEPRATIDVDVMVLTGLGGEPPVIDALLDRFTARVDDAAAFARRNRVLLLETAERIGIDVALAAIPYEQRVIARASDHELVAGRPLRICSAEDLVVLRAFAGRTIDWADIERVVARVGAGLDVDLVLDEAMPLLEIKEASGDLERLRTLLGR